MRLTCNKHSINVTCYELKCVPQNSNDKGPQKAIVFGDRASKVVIRLE